MKYILLITCTLALQFGFSQHTLTPESSITDVSVFSSGAQIKRAASISLKLGENIVILKGLAQDINSNSLNVTGNPNYLIKSVKHQMNFLEDASKNSELLSIESELKDTDFKLGTRFSLERVYKEEKNLLMANKSIKGESQSLLAEDLKEMAAFYREHLEELEYKLLEINQEKQELQLKKQKLQQQLNKSRSMMNGYSSEIEIVLNATRNVIVPLEVSYIVSSAGWFVTYDIRTSEVDKPIQLVYKANVSQSTGLDWSNINLTLSSGNPMVNGNKPSLEPWYMSVYNAGLVYGAYKLQQSNKSDDGERKDKYEEVDFNTRSFNSPLGYTSQLTESVESLLSVEFKISIPYDIPSNGEAYEVEIQRGDINSDYSYYAAPSLETTAFLLSRLTDWSELNLLPGEANVFFQGSFVGSSFLDPYSTEDTLDVSLGKDKNIIISRDKMEDFCKSSNFGGNKKTNRAYKIAVKNNKSIPVFIKVEDQVPISQQNDISVTVGEIIDGSINEKTGIITWEINLDPGETKEVSFSFEVKHPKKMKIARL
tara:strand:- start:9019 stop:10638 length:1620 start_codon:yes stop_codon:yes gene_type:complete